jgi:protein phosphatase PTC7
MPLLVLHIIWLFGMILTTIHSLGDSGYAHLSPLHLNHLSTPQTHAFNTPFQLSKIPTRLSRQLDLFGRGHHAERPADADIYVHDVNHGDVLVLGTDGVWDNLAPEDVLKVVSRHMLTARAWEVPEDGHGAVRVGAGLAGKVESSQQEGEGRLVDLSTVLAWAIVREAKLASVNDRRDGPFAKEVKKYFPHENYSGGKVDDICCVVGVCHAK